MHTVDQGGGKARTGEVGLRQLEIFFGQHAEANPLAERVASLQDQAMMAALLQPAQPDRAVLLVADDEAEQIDIESP